MGGWYYFKNQTTTTKTQWLGYRINEKPKREEKMAKTSCILFSGCNNGP